MTRSDDTLLAIKLTGRGDRRWKAHGSGRGTRVTHKMVRRLFQEIDDESQDGTSEIQTERNSTTPRHMEG